MSTTSTPPTRNNALVETRPECKSGPARASEARMFAAWLACSRAEQNGLPVAHCQRLYDRYDDALHAHVRLLAAQIMATARGPWEERARDAR